ncbi:phosphatase domain-containing protein [Pseudomonas sp. EL_65y_Pfl2_R95]|uniref:phosphatase domain-containing protein n=1 Tax=Pseudomonas sp. EL_65y_Pfl2_R95 TaxID=3088698 RepID=UPI0030D76145
MLLPRRKIILGVAAIGIAVTAYAGIDLGSVKALNTSSISAQHQQQWAVPVDKGFNLYQMSPNLYRSALPDSDDLASLKAANVTTVVSFIKDDDKQWIGSAQMSTVSIPLHADRVTDADVIRVLHVLEEGQKHGSVLMHCKHGRDRTGLMAAMYRMVIQGWSKPEAINEMRRGGYGDPQQMEDALAYVEQADPVKIRAAYEAGECSTTMLSTCYAKRWVQNLLAVNL